MRESTTTDFERFIARLRDRLEAGEAAYGDASFQRDPVALLDEVAEELLDVCGWSFVLLSRLDLLRTRLAKD